MLGKAHVLALQEKENTGERGEGHDESRFAGLIEVLIANLALLAPLAELRAHLVIHWHQWRALLHSPMAEENVALKVAVPNRNLDITA